MRRALAIKLAQNLQEKDHRAAKGLGLRSPGSMYEADTMASSANAKRE
jgi:hypothetical protein